MSNNNPCPATYLKCDEGFCTCRREKQISSIDWLVKELKLEGYDYTVEQAKSMHEQEIKRAFIIGGGVEYHEINTNADEYFIEEFNQ